MKSNDQKNIEILTQTFSWSILAIFLVFSNLEVYIHWFTKLGTNFIVVGIMLLGKVVKMIIFAMAILRMIGIDLMGLAAEKYYYHKRRVSRE